MAERNSPSRQKNGAAHLAGGDVHGNEDTVDADSPDDRGVEHRPGGVEHGLEAILPIEPMREQAKVGSEGSLLIRDSVLSRSLLARVDVIWRFSGYHRQRNHVKQRVSYQAQPAISSTASP